MKRDFPIMSGEKTQNLYVFQLFSYSFFLYYKGRSKIAAFKSPIFFKDGPTNFVS